MIESEKIGQIVVIVAKVGHQSPMYAEGVTINVINS